MATTFLLKPNITLNPLTNQYSFIQLSSVYKPFAKSPSFPRLISNPKLTVRCSASTENLNKPVLKQANKETKTNPYEVFANAVLESLKPLQDTLNSVTVALFMVVTWLCTVSSALAASGGRMGGRSFSSSSPSYSSPSPSYSSPSPSYSSPSPSYSSPSPSPSYSSPSPLYSSPSPSYSSPSPSPSPSPSYSSRRSSSSYRSPSSSTASFWSSPPVPYGDVTILKSAPSKSETLVESVSVNSEPPSITQQNNGIWVSTNVCIASAAFLLLALGYVGSRNSNLASGASVIKLQVGLLGLARSLQMDLNEIAETADTSKKEDLSYILKETTLAILRHPDYCISGYSSVEVKNNMEVVETLFDRLCIEERAKLDEETLVNVDNRKKQNKISKETKGFNNEYIVITILVAAEGVYKLPKISSIGDLNETLKTLGSILTDKLLAVEVLWTPQEENDTLTEQEMLEDYPLLRLYK